MRSPGSRRVARELTAPLGGLLVAASMPPWGWWPAAFIGLTLWESSLRNAPTRVRWRRSALFSLAWLAPSVSWMWQFTVPGYIVVLSMFAVLHATITTAVPGGPDDRWRWLVLPSALTVAEALRFCFPFGGMPLASLAIGQVGGPLVGLSRIGGAVLLTFAVAFIGTNLRRALAALRPDRPWSALRAGRAVSSIAVLPALVTLGTFAPRGSSLGRSATIAIVQGGGPQGTRAIHSKARLVLDRALVETAKVAGPADVVIWPENIVNVHRLDTSEALAEVAAEARRLDAPFIVGITEDGADPRKQFRNAQVVVMPDGSIIDRYEKKRRVPFGEYMPLRSLLSALGAPTRSVPRDAMPGTTPAVLETPVGTMGVAISWEIFFGGRVREAVRNGAEVVLNPTNNSSYRGTVLQTQQLASSRLRAIESGRWVVQIAPTGFSGFVSPAGRVHDRTRQTEAAWRRRTIDLRGGLTWYERTGDLPWVLVALLGWSWPAFVGWRARLRRRGDATADAGLTRPPAP
jgi:apolipoprotein N-acyltransferase